MPRDEACTVVSCGHGVNASCQQDCIELMLGRFNTAPFHTPAAPLIYLGKASAGVKAVGARPAQVVKDSMLGKQDIHDTTLVLDGGQ